ncbi:MFS transporter [Alicyclobacillus sp. ALC3]|uniref:MFS transporter n=1 Tax=Alicyclobacillus sp. ALC3 TaxID=2796143 RepID=UPI002377D284|nr:MFS transporter [Alicyclobacillus sp. ALC3]WDL95640.1 MFS transporter [Alicyclobacillus sp. ALC3]
MSNETADPLARLERIPVWPYGKVLLLLIGAGYFFAFFDIVNMGFALPSISSQLHTPISHVAIAINWNLWGYIVGALVISVFSDSFGRKRSVIAAMFLFTIGSLITAFTSSVSWIVFGRFVVGLGDGAMIAQVTTYLSELSPAKLRGRYTAVATSCAYFASAVVPFAALWLVPHYTWGWRGLLFIGAFGGIAGLIGTRYIVESPRWLVGKGRLNEAEKIVAAAEQVARRKIGQELPKVVALPEEPRAAGFPLKHLLHPRYLGYLILILVVWCWMYVGTYGFLGLSTTLLVQRGYSLSNSIGFESITSLGYLVGLVVSLLLADRVERKFLAVGFGLIYGVFTALIGFTTSGTEIMVLGFIQSIAIPSFFIAAYPLTAEHFPTSGRSSAVAATDGIGHFGGAIAAPLVLMVDGHAGFTGAFVFMGATIVIGSLLTMFTRRATGKSLNVVTARETLAPAPSDPAV